MTIAFALYSFLVAAIVWIGLVPWELMRIGIGRSTASDLRARLGAAMPPGTGRPCVLIHAVSAGETAAARGLIAALCATCPQISVVLTTCTQAGRDIGRASQRTFPQIVECTWLPWDRFRPLRRWMRHLSPDAVVVIETEIWPNLYRACRRERIPLFIANGRVYPEDLQRYRFARRFFREVLGCVEWIGVQSDRERDAFAAIGASAERLHVIGNLKFDAPPASSSLPASLVRDLAANTPLIIAGSTHGPEEEWLISGLANMRRQMSDIRLVLTPRNVARARTIGRIVERHKLLAALLSAHERSKTWDVLVVDSMGSLSLSTGTRPSS